MSTRCERCGRALRNRKVIFSIEELGNPLVDGRPLESRREFCIQCFDEYITWYVQGLKIGEKMSNEYKAWIEDKVTEVLFDAGELTYINTIWPQKLGISLVHGHFNDEERTYEVWLGEDKWEFKRVDN